jgi:hypothetical protein
LVFFDFGAGKVHSTGSEMMPFPISSCDKRVSRVALDPSSTYTLTFSAHVS